VSKVLLGVAGVVLIRFMPEIEYASYTLAVSLIAVVTQTVVLSFKRIYIIGYERFKIASSPSSFLGFQLWCIFLIVLITLPFKDFTQEVYWFIVASVIATCLSEFSKTVVQQQLKFLQFSIIEIARTLVFVLSLLLLIYFIRYDLKAWQVLVVQATAMFVVFLVAFSRYLELSRLLKIEESIRLAVTLLKGEYKYVFGYFFIFAFFAQVDVFVLKALAGTVELATYGSAFRYYSLLLLALGAVHTVLLPVVQRVHSISELESILGQHRRMLLLFVPLVLFGAWISQWIIPWIDKGKYPDAVMVFQILAISAVISFAFSPHSNLLMRFEDFRFLFVSICFGLLVNVGLCVWLVPMLSATGPAIATVIAFGGVNGSIFLRARKHRKSLASLQQGDS
jgi:O-antigen/teichoic acid export membrane protein